MYGYVHFCNVNFCIMAIINDCLYIMYSVFGKVGGKEFGTKVNLDMLVILNLQT